MPSADERKESEFALAKPYLGTGALSAASLFDVTGWVCVGECTVVVRQATTHGG
jgi:hypothetical protein